MTELNPMDNLVLGIDLGTNSLGWALLDMDAKKIVAAGSRVFKAAAEGNIEQGRDESPNVKRRQARQARDDSRRYRWPARPRGKPPRLRLA